MKLIGRLVKDAKIIRETVVQRDESGKPFRDVLEECFLEVCKGLDIPVPLWLKKNTTEFGAYKRTFFNSEHFLEEVHFDKFELKFEQD